MVRDLVKAMRTSISPNHKKMKTLALCISVFLLAPTLHAGGGSGKNKKEQPANGREDYYKYEREEVKHLRDLYEFNMPEIVAAPARLDQPGGVDPSISLNAYFQKNNRYYFDQDTRLEQYRARHIEINQDIKELPGWRVQVFTGSVRTNAFGVKNSLMSLYPEMAGDSDIEYVMPNYKVLLGNFLDKEDAEMFCRRVREEQFPGAFLVQKMIRIPEFKVLQNDAELLGLPNRN